MSAKTFPVDAGDVTRKLKTPWAIDAGGVPRKGKKIWIIDPGGIARLVFQGIDILSLFTATVNNFVGFSNGAFGNLTPGTLGDGSVVQQMGVSNHLSPTPHNGNLIISGYPGTITANYLTSLQFGATTVLTPSSPGFSFSGGAPGGQAEWDWTGTADFIQTGVTLQVTIVRS